MKESCVYLVKRSEYWYELYDSGYLVAWNSNLDEIKEDAERADSNYIFEDASTRPKEKE